MIEKTRFMVRSFRSVWLLLTALIIQVSTAWSQCPTCNNGGKSQKVNWSCGVDSYYDKLTEVKVIKTFKGESVVKNIPTADNQSTADGTVDCEVGGTVTIEAAAEPRSPGEPAWVSASVSNCPETIGKSDLGSVSVSMTLKSSTQSSPGSCQKKNGSVQLQFGIGAEDEGVGSIWMEERQIDVASFGPLALHYYQSGQAVKIPRGGPPDGPFQQVLTQSCLAHVEPTGDGLELRYFWRFQVTGNGDLPYQVTGGNTVANTFVTYRISDPGETPEGYPRLQLTEIRPNAADKVTIWTRKQGVTDEWEMDDVTGNRAETKVVTDGGLDGSFTIDRAVKMNVNGALALVQESQEIYENNLLIGQRLGASVGGILTTYSYDANGEVQSVDRPSDGYWERAGRMKRTFDANDSRYSIRPVGDLAPVATPPTSNGEVPNGDVTWRRTGVGGSATERRIDDVVVGRTEEVDSITTIADGFEGKTHTSRRYPAPNAIGLWSMSTKYTNDANTPAYLHSQPYWSRDERGRTKTYTYALGTIDASGEFAVSGEGSYRRQVMTEGDESVGSIVGSSRRTVTIKDSQDLKVVEEEHICAGVDSFTRISRTLHQYDTLGHVVLSTRDGRVTFESHYINENKDWEIDETGVRTEYSNWDDAGRARTIVRKGFVGAGPNAPAQPDRTMTLEFDSEGRTLTEAVSSGADQMTRSWQYDTAGRLIKETVNGVETTYAYSIDATTGGKIETKTLPGGLTEITRYYLDGKVKSVSGTAVVPRCYTYGVEAGEANYLDLLWEKEEIGSIIPGSAGSIWTKRIENWIGQLCLEESPRPGQAGTIRREPKYNDRGEQTEQWINGIKVSTIAYDLMGNSQVQTRWLSESQSVNETTSRSLSEIGTGNWYQVTTRGNHSTYVRLSGFTLTSSYGPMMNYTFAQNTEGDYSEQTIYLDRANKAVRTIALRGEMGDVGETITRNGVLEAERAPGDTAWHIYTYDGLGRRTKAKDPRTGLETIWTYDGTFPEQIATETLTVPAGSDPAAGQSRTIVNVYYGATVANGGKLYSRTENGQTTYYAYSDHGDQTAQWGATYPVRYVHDALGRLSTMETYRDEPGGNQSSWSSGDLTTWNYHPGTTALAGKTDAENRSVSYAYNSFGQMNQRTWARGYSTNYEYDWQGQLTHIDYTDGVTQAITWTTPDMEGHYTQLTDAAGTHTLTYGTDGVLTGDAIAAGGILGGVSVTATRGSNGRIEGLASSVGATPLTDQSYGYEANNGRLNSVHDWTTNVTVSYSYLPNSQLLQTTDTTLAGQTNLTGTRVWDGLDRLSSLAYTQVGGTVAGSSTYQYDSQGRREKLTEADGRKWVFGYNSRNEVVSGQHRLGNETPVLGSTFGYNYDAIGNRITTTVNGRQSTYTPTELNQYYTQTVPGAFDVLGEADASALVRVNDGTTERQGTTYYRAVPVDNSTSPVEATVTVKALKSGGGAPSADYVKTLPVNGAPNRVWVSRTPKSITYDYDGNLTWDGEWMYTWDGENRLIAVERGNERYEYAYDARGRRVAKRSLLNGVLQSEERFVYDLGWNLLAVVDGNLVPKQTFLWGADLSGGLEGAGGVGGLVAMSDVVNGATCGYTFDGNGNVAKLVNLSSGVIEALYEYGPFGEVLRATGVMAEKNPFTFSTQYADSNTGLLYAKRRYYDPAIARWLSRDPIQEEGGINLYGYVQNAPIDFIDPLGLECLFESVTGITLQGNTQTGWSGPKDFGFELQWVITLTYKTCLDPYGSDSPAKLEYSEYPRGEYGGQAPPPDEWTDSYELAGGDTGKEDDMFTDWRKRDFVDKKNRGNIRSGMTKSIRLKDIPSRRKEGVGSWTELSIQTKVTHGSAAEASEKNKGRYTTWKGIFHWHKNSTQRNHSGRILSNNLPIQ